MHRIKLNNIYNKTRVLADEIKINHLDVYLAGTAFYLYSNIRAVTA